MLADDDRGWSDWSDCTGERVILGAGEEVVVPSAGVTAGVRITTVGNLRVRRHPVGVNLGLRAPLSLAAALRIEYQLRRMLGDPIADFTEHRVAMGFSLLWDRCGH